MVAVVRKDMSHSSDTNVVAVFPLEHGEDTAVCMLKNSGCMWHAEQRPGAPRSGIKGFIERPSSAISGISGDWIPVAVVCRRYFAQETEHSFDFITDESVIEYWPKHPVNVLLVVFNLRTRDLYVKTITAREIYRALGEPLKIHFDKREDKFDATNLRALVMMAFPPDDPPTPEQLANPRKYAIVCHPRHVHRPARPGSKK